MIRDWIRALRRKGIAAFLMPLLVIVMMVYGYVEYVDNYFEHLDEADSVSTKLEASNEVIRIAREMDKRKIVLKPDYDLWQSRAFVAPTREAALEAMKASLTQTLQNLYFEKVQIDVPKADAPKAAEKTTEKTTDLIALEAQFIGVPQQLPRLEAELQTQAQSIRVSDVKIKAVIPPKPVATKATAKKATAAAASAPVGTDPYLEITVRFVAPYLATAAVVTATAPMPAASAASKPQVNTPNTK